MNKAYASALGLVCASLVAGCGSSDAPVIAAQSTASAPSSPRVPSDSQDSGRYGILVPAVATNPTLMGAESISFDLPGMSFDEAVRWMEAHLPLDVNLDGLMPCGAKQSAGMHSWYWRGGADAPMLSVTVFDAPITQVGIFGGTDPVGC
ncbi:MULTISPECIES: hypothetical protein [Rhodococcus]|uniref:hypothetical protein n=1 Tax=Rhodococcus TaxID=1827 RepID=UPI0007180EB8|nr:MULTISPECIES: hypothetical protein [Rhodococcus]MEA1798300.1 hypothetical protein [Rhodococcus qingshengii]